MKKNIIIILCTTIGIALIGKFAVDLYYEENKDKKPDIEIEPIENSRFETLKSALKDSTYFKNSEITASTSKEVATVDGKYDISIKNGYYMMTIRDMNQIDKYCEIVDAIEQSLGAKEGESLLTCKETLNGSINVGDITADIYDTYKVLTVSSETPAKLYNVENSHGNDDLISVDEINYNIKIDDYLLTSMSTNFIKESNQYNICGNIYNAKEKEGKLIFSIYDNDSNKVNEKEYAYSNSTKKYLTFCVDFSLDIDNIKYYSVKKD